MNVMQERVAILDLKRLTDAHAGDAGSVDTTALVDHQGLCRNRHLGKGALQLYKNIGQTAVDIRNDRFLDHPLAGVDPGAHGIDAHPDNRITGQLSTEMNMPLDGSGITLRSHYTGL